MRNVQIKAPSVIPFVLSFPNAVGAAISCVSINHCTLQLFLSLLKFAERAVI